MIGQGSRRDLGRASRSTPYWKRGACVRRPLTDNLRFALGLSGVAVGAALFAIAFRLSLAWLYRSAYHADNVFRSFRSRS